MRAVLKSPILQKVYIYYGDDGNPDSKVKIGIDISKGSESSGNEITHSASDERITNSFDLESDRVTTKNLVCNSEQGFSFCGLLKFLFIYRKQQEPRRFVLALLHIDLPDFFACDVCECACDEFVNALCTDIAFASLTD